MKHPDRFVSELTFVPSNLTIQQLKEYASSNSVGIATLTEKSELVSVASDIYKRTGNPPSFLQSKIDAVNDSFSRVTLAYETLGDPSKRRMYDLTGEWGEEVEFVPLREGGRADMGDREEAERVRER